MTLAAKPLYKGNHPRELPAGGHTGLWYDKFCDDFLREESAQAEQEKAKKEQEQKDRAKGLKPKQREKPRPPKSLWIDTVTNRSIGDSSLIDELIGRRCLLGSRLGGKLLYVQSTARFVTGLGREHPVENGFAWHPTLGTPYLPGSGVKGITRAWARLLAEGDPRIAASIAEVFGSQPNEQGQQGRVLFLDALPVEPVTLSADVMTPHYGPYYRDGEPPGDWHSPIPIPYLTVAPGMRLQLLLLGRDSKAGELVEQAATWLNDALRELGAGAKTASGYGRFESIDGSQYGAEWLAMAEQERLARRPPLERAQAEIAAMSEQQAIDCLRARIGEQAEADPDYREALRQALNERYGSTWAKKGKMGRLGWDKQREHLRWLRGE